MKRILILFIIFNIFFICLTQAQQKPILNLNDLIDEALQKSLELNSLNHKIRATETFTAQTSYFETPELTFRLMEVPGLKPSEAMFANIEIMQMINFPVKTQINKKITSVELDIQNQIYNEQSVRIIMDIKTAYYKLWMVQKNIELNKFRKILIDQIINIAREKYKTGLTSQQDIFKAQIELANAEIQELELIQEEEATFAMIASLLNKDIKNFKGIAIIPDTIVIELDYDKIESYALKYCSKLRSDSLTADKYKLFNRLAKIEYFPDFKIGVEYVSSPLSGFRGWSLTTGISLPFSFFSIKRTNARVIESEYNMLSAKTNYHNERNMLIAKVREYYAKLNSLKQQLDLYHKKILPFLEQTLNITLKDYQTERTDFHNYLDSYIKYFEENTKAIMKRYEYEKTLAELEKEIGCRDIEEVMN